MTTLPAYTIGADGLSLVTYVLDLATGAESNQRVETFRSPRARHARIATLSETHTNSARIRRIETPHAVAYAVREPALADVAMYLNGELVGFARSYADGERVIDTILAERGKRGRLAAAATRVTISAEPRKRRVQIVRFAGLTATRSRVYYGVTPSSLARLARLTGGAPHAELAA